MAEINNKNVSLKATINNIGTVDEHYDPTSENAQSGTAVNEAVSPILSKTALANSSEYTITTGGWKRLAVITRAHSGKLQWCIATMQTSPDGTYHGTYRNFQSGIISYSTAVHLPYVGDKAPGSAEDYQVNNIAMGKPELHQVKCNMFGEDNTFLPERQVIFTKFRICYPKTNTVANDNPVRCYLDGYIAKDNEEITSSSIIVEIVGGVKIKIDEETNVQFDSDGNPLGTIANEPCDYVEIDVIPNRNEITKDIASDEIFAKSFFAIKESDRYDATDLLNLHINNCFNSLPSKFEFSVYDSGTVDNTHLIQFFKENIVSHTQTQIGKRYNTVGVSRYVDAYGYLHANGTCSALDIATTDLNNYYIAYGPDSNTPKAGIYCPQGTKLIIRDCFIRLATMQQWGEYINGVSSSLDITSLAFVNSWDRPTSSSQATTYPSSARYYIVPEDMYIVNIGFMYCPFTTYDENIKYFPQVVYDAEFDSSLSDDVITSDFPDEISHFGLDVFDSSALISVSGINPAIIDYVNKKVYQDIHMSGDYEDITNTEIAQKLLSFSIKGNILQLQSLSSGGTLYTGASSLKYFKQVPMTEAFIEAIQNNEVPITIEQQTAIKNWLGI